MFKKEDLKKDRRKNLSFPLGFFQNKTFLFKNCPLKRRLNFQNEKKNEHANFESHTVLVDIPCLDERQKNTFASIIFYFVSGEIAFSILIFVQYYTVTLQRLWIIVRDSGIAPRTSATEVWSY